jgi:hypothetical protein
MNESPENKANLRLFRYSLYNSNNWYVMLDAPVAKLACQNNKVHSVYHLRLESWLAYSSVLLMMCWFWVLSFECRPFCCSPSCHVDFVVKCTLCLSGLCYPCYFTCLNWQETYIRECTWTCDDFTSDTTINLFVMQAKDFFFIGL